METRERWDWRRETSTFRPARTIGWGLSGILNSDDD
jgi:hypothetical protein